MMFSVSLFFLCHVAFVSAAAGDTLGTVQRHTPPELSKAVSGFLEVSKSTVASVESDFHSKPPADGNSVSEIKQETIKTTETLKDETNGATKKMETIQGASTEPPGGVNVVTNTNVGINIGTGANSGNSPMLTGGGGNYSMPSAASGRTFSAAPGRYGSPLCPCIGFDGVKGSIDFGMDPDGKANTTRVWANAGEQPADYGAHCDGWARPGDQSTGDKTKSTSGSKWCFIDAHNCDWNSLPDVPKKSLTFPLARQQDKGIFYSYATCGDVDAWTAQNNKDACPLRTSAEECKRVEAGNEASHGRNCAWMADLGTKYTGSNKQIQCLGADLLHVDQSKQQVEMLESSSQDANGHVGVPKWGKPSCKCIGMSKGVNKRTYKVKTGKLDSIVEFDIAGRTGATCGAWDKAGGNVGRESEGIEGHPFCRPDAQKPIPDWCEKKWCYVDGCDCNGLLAAPKVTTYFRDGGSYQGHTLYYSYSTCAGDQDSSETNTYTTKEFAPQSCFVQDSEADCNSPITLGRCTWVPTANGGKCKGTELVNKEACNLK